MSGSRDSSFAMVWGSIGLATDGATILPLPSCFTRNSTQWKRNRYCLGDEADTFSVSVVLAVHAGRWSAEELARHLEQHRKFFIGGPAGKEGLLLEIVPGTLKKVDGENSGLFPT